MPHVLSTPAPYTAKSYKNAKGSAECVEFIKQTLDAPLASTWREGTKITKLAPGTLDQIRAGTAIATFIGGRYPMSGHSGMHAAIYMGQNDDGIIVLDQWRGKPFVSQRLIPWTPQGNSLSNNGGAFSVIEW